MPEKRQKHEKPHRAFDRRCLSGGDIGAVADGSKQIKAHPHRQYGRNHRQAAAQQGIQRFYQQWRVFHYRQNGSIAPHQQHQQRLFALRALQQQPAQPVDERRAQHHRRAAVARQCKKQQAEHRQHAVAASLRQQIIHKKCQRQEHKNKLY